MRVLFFTSLLLFAVQGVAQDKTPTIEIEEAWSRATPPGSTIGVGYMVIRNKSEERERLLSVSSPLARKVETHVTLKDGNITRMREVPGYEVPGRGRVELKPGSAHLMLLDIKRPFKQGEKIPVTLRFERSGEIQVEMEVRAAGATAPADKADDHMMHGDRKM
jgi:copper(I)-binding protein